jgi:hypothetical protein
VPVSIICIDGERACPPEDCGGADGYYNVLDTLSDPDHDDHESMRTWVGGDWDPENSQNRKELFLTQL